MGGDCQLLGFDWSRVVVPRDTGVSFRWTLIGPSWRHANTRRFSGRYGLWM